MLTIVPSNQAFSVLGGSAKTFRSVSMNKKTVARFGNNVVRYLALGLGSVQTSRSFAQPNIDAPLASKTFVGTQNALMDGSVKKHNNFVTIHNLFCCLCAHIVKGLCSEASDLREVMSTVATF